MDKEPGHSGEFRGVMLGFQGMWLLDTETSIFTPTRNRRTQQRQRPRSCLLSYLAIASCIMDDEMCCMTPATFALMITA